ncbi:hypothetical protein QSJ18_14895 [Gordonia sp. ABSL1-1]|uniref:LVIVD repeat-containing protein n=1 Tax=Gordonia sp. ABSL1-1 TaxID=3053923 RepID=UPI00257482DC|nr:hypothetical protein [Gordonia sp. ABSL1-1]MDL9938038.1 hypothetical protein [Gordonia sp. ABSL1-1]
MPGVSPNHSRRKRRPLRTLGVFVVGVALTATTLSFSSAPADAGNHFFPNISETAVPRADCGPGSLPERGLQGDVSAEDRNSGRSRAGYRCNMTKVGNVRGSGGGIVSATFDHCSYTGSLFPGDNFMSQPGVQVVDSSNPRAPRIVGSLKDTAMRGGTWETLKVNKKRKLLAATSVPLLWGGGFFAVYDISDCAHPRLLNKVVGTRTPLPFTSHEGGFSPDGRTYWASGIWPGHLSAIDIANPAVPRVIWQGLQAFVGHGFGITPDGNRMYISNAAGVTVLDISAVQRRAPYPQVPHVAAYLWPDGQVNQHTIPVTYRGRPHIVTVDELGSGGVKIFDVTKVNKPDYVAQIKLEINLPKNLDTNFRSGMGGSVFNSNPHYCTVDRPDDPTALACSWESSGIRVFDIKNVRKIREIGYYNPPAQKGATVAQLPNSPHVLGSLSGVPAVEFLSLGMAILNGKVSLPQMIGPRVGMVVGGDMATDWCFSPPTWHGNQIWTTCSDGGFYALNLSRRVYTPPANQDTTIG